MISYAVPTLNYLTFVVYVNVTQKWRHSKVETAVLAPIYILNVSAPWNCDVIKNDVMRILRRNYFISERNHFFCIFNKNYSEKCF